jgi:hypothetical protein
MAARAVALIMVATALSLAACGSTVTPATGSAEPSSNLAAQIIASELTVGRQQRVPIGILSHNTPVSDATVRVRAFLLQSGNTAVLKGESDAPFKGEGLEGAGAYVARLDLLTAGGWGLQITASRPNGERLSQQLPISVLAAPVIPGVGQPAPPSRSPTTADQDATVIDSGRPPDDMHQLSIAAAIEQHRPTLVVFASPAFCTSRICGPEVKVVQSLEPAYRNRLTFIHVEIYTNFVPDPAKRQLAPTVLDWRLQTEPWIFLIDARGIIRDRYEGPTAADELRVAIDGLLR